MAIYVHRTDMPVTVVRWVPLGSKSTTDWLENPPGERTLTAAQIPQKYWKVVGEDVVEMDAAEKQAVDDAIAAESLELARSTAANLPNETSSQGLSSRAGANAGARRDRRTARAMRQAQDMFEAIIDAPGFPAAQAALEALKPYIRLKEPERDEHLDEYVAEVKSGDNDAPADVDGSGGVGSGSVGGGRR